MGWRNFKGTLKHGNSPRGTLKLGHLEPVNLKLLHAFDIVMSDDDIGTAMRNCGFVRYMP